MTFAAHAAMPAIDTRCHSVLAAPRLALSNRMGSSEVAPLGASFGDVPVFAPHRSLKADAGPAAPPVGVAPAPGPAQAPPPAPAVPAPALPEATAAVFSESSTARFNGYDASTAPNWLIVPSGGTRTAQAVLTPAPSQINFASADTGKATVAAAGAGITVSGVAAGDTKIEARNSSGTLATLRVAVRGEKTVSTGFNFVSDSAAPTPHATTGATGDATTLLAGVNLVWQQQANVRFTNGGARAVTAPGDLGPTVDTTAATVAGDEWSKVVALGSGKTHNVFRVWDLRVDGNAVNGGVNDGANTLIADASCADGLGLPHESGHHLTLNHPAGGIMTPCGSRTDRRVTKAMLDVVNP